MATGLIIGISVVLTVFFGVFIGFAFATIEWLKKLSKDQGSFHDTIRHEVHQFSSAIKALRDELSISLANIAEAQADMEVSLSKNIERHSTELVTLSHSVVLVGEGIQQILDAITAAKNQPRVVTSWSTIRKANNAFNRTQEMEAQQREENTNHESRR